jgi:uncharacterized protein (TIGR02145 family)
MRATIKQVLQTLRGHFGESIFSNPKQFKAALADVPIETDGKRIRNLLNIAMCEMKAYSRLESSLSNNTFIVDNLSAELSSDFMIDVSAAKMVIENIAELLGYKPVVVPKLTDWSKFDNLHIPRSPVAAPQVSVVNWNEVISAPDANPRKFVAKRRQLNDGGIFTDPRDGQEYRTVKIGNQIWMAENLNYKTGKCWAYENDESNRQKYGLLYDWETAKSACPKGWHLPTTKEWDQLMSAAGGEKTADKKLKSKTGWDKNGNGTDDFGFSALPGGYRYIDGRFLGVGNYGPWWSATENGSGDAYDRYMDYYFVCVCKDEEGYGFSVRCVKDV